MTENERKLVEENLITVKSLVRNMVSSGKISRDDYDDYYQYGCMVLCEKVAKYDGRAKFNTFADTVVRNAFVDLYRKNKNNSLETLSLSQIVSDDDADEGAELMEFLNSGDNTENEAISKITNKQLIDMIHKAKRTCTAATTVKGFEALELKISGYTGSEIAKMYNVPANSLRTWMSRAKKILLSDERFVSLLSN